MLRRTLLAITAGLVLVAPAFAQTQTEDTTMHAPIVPTPAETGYAPVNGLELYYEAYGEGEPLVLLHGGLGLTTMFAPILPILAEGRQVIAVDLQGHGRTADIDRPIRHETMAADVAALIEHLGLEKTDVMGYSMGGGVALRLAIDNPQLVDKLVLVSTVYSRNGWFPEIRAQQAQMSGAGAEFMKETPMYQSYIAAAPNPDAFPQLLDKMGDLMREPYDWSEQVQGITAPTLLIYGDADMVSTSYMAEFFNLLGGGLKDGGWDGSGMSNARLAIIPGETHYSVFMAPEMAETAVKFLEGE